MIIVQGWECFELFRVGVLPLRSESKMKKSNKKSGKKANDTQSKATKSKVTAEIFLEKLKPLGIETKKDKAGNIGVKVNGSAITYINRRTTGFHYQMKKRVKGKLNWYPSTTVTSETQIEELVSGIKDFKESKDNKILIKLGFLDKDTVIKK